MHRCVCILLLIIHLCSLSILAQFDDDEETEPIPLDEDMVAFHGGRRLVGYHDPQFAETGEHPHRYTSVQDFQIDRFPVTNGQFRKFVEETNYYTTEADMKTYSMVFMGHESKKARLLPRNMVDPPWWRRAYGARWNTPYGPGSDINDSDMLPVVHVSISDAAIYCDWLGKRLPTEDEWEYAARLNDKGWRYPWGDSYRANRMNTWQGFFPTGDEGWDGYRGLSPVDTFHAQNQAGMRDMIGNAWEWTSTLFHGEHPAPRQPGVYLYTLKGGSFADCPEGEGEHLIRASSRMGQPETHTAENVGFRCAKDYKRKEEPPKVHYYKETYKYRQEMRSLNERYRILREKNDAIKRQLKKSFIDKMKSKAKGEL